MKVCGMLTWLPDLEKASRALACAAVAALACLVAQPGRAQPVIDFGGQTSCSTWLSVPAATRQGLSWLYGAWSGLNMAGGMRNDVYDVGHTLKADEVAGLVERACRQNMAKVMSQAVLEAYVATRAARR